MDFKLCTGVSVKAENDWLGVGRPQVAMQSQLSHFLVIYVFPRYTNWALPHRLPENAVNHRLRRRDVVTMRKTTHVICRKV